MDRRLPPPLGNAGDLRTPSPPEGEGWGGGTLREAVELARLLDLARTRIDRPSSDSRLLLDSSPPPCPPPPRGRVLLIFTGIAPLGRVGVGARSGGTSPGRRSGAAAAVGSRTA